MAGRIITLGDDTIKGLMSNSRLVQEFPIFRSPPKVSAGCGSCGSKRTKTDYRKIRMVISKLPAMSKEKFKQILGVNKVKIRYRSDTGKTVNTEF